MGYKNLIRVPDKTENNIFLKEKNLIPLRYGKINSDDDRYQYIIRTDTREEIMSIRTDGDFFGYAIKLNPNYHFEIGIDNSGDLILVPVKEDLRDRMYS
jgi:hypothetical protein